MNILSSRSTYRITRGHRLTTAKLMGAYGILRNVPPSKLRALLRICI